MNYPEMQSDDRPRLGPILTGTVALLMAASLWGVVHLIITKAFPSLLRVNFFWVYLPFLVVPFVASLAGCTVAGAAHYAFIRRRPFSVLFKTASSSVFVMLAVATYSGPGLARGLPEKVSGFLFTNDAGTFDGVVKTWSAYVLLTSAMAVLAMGTDRGFAISHRPGKRSPRHSRVVSGQLGWRPKLDHTLFWLMLLGGWPGTIVAACLFHHKLKRRKYQIAFLFCTVAHLSFVGPGVAELTHGIRRRFAEREREMRENNHEYWEQIFRDPGAEFDNDQFGSSHAKDSSMLAERAHGAPIGGGQLGTVRGKT